MLTNVKEIALDQLKNEVWAMRRDGYRLVTVTCTDLGEAHDLIYHFDKQYELRHLRLSLPKGQSLPSITSVFFCAVLAENEIKDFFGLEVTDLPIDYQGRFLLSDGAPKAPMSKVGGIPLDVRMKAPAAAAGAEGGAARGA